MKPLAATRDPGVAIVARANLPTRFGDFAIVGFENSIDGREHIALVRGRVDGAEAVPTRVHSECLTGDALGSLRCDCRDQLELALGQLGRSNRGVLLYLRQEGRGIGLVNKLRAYALQDSGLDTVEANHHLGFDDDLRDYRSAAAMLAALAVRSIVLLTNNPRKIEGLSREGIRIRGRRALETLPTPYNRFYLATKQSKSGHLLSVLDSSEAVPPAVAAQLAPR